MIIRDFFLTERQNVHKGKCMTLLLMQDHMGIGDSTNDIAHLLGMLDPWYERNTLSLLNLPANIVCQV